MADAGYAEAVTRIVNGAAVQVWGKPFEVEATGAGCALIVRISPSLMVQVDNGSGQAQWPYGSELRILLQLIVTGVDAPGGGVHERCTLVGVNQLHGVLATFSRWSTVADQRPMNLIL